LYRTPVKVRPHSSEDAAEAAPMRKWCWMPRYPVTLEQLGRPMPVLRATTVIEQMSTALRKLHSEGLAHMDVKPSNIFVTPDGQLLLGDFGCVRRFGEKVGTTPAFVPQDMQKQSYAASALHDWWMLAMTVSDVHLAQSPSREPGAGASEARTEEVRSTLRSMRTAAADRLLEQLH
jgi:serine/threonine protein kinase